MTSYEQALLARAAAWPEHPCWQGLTAEVLREVGAREGNDFATALTYDRLLRSADHGSFMRLAACSETPRPSDGALLAVVPGACYREYPHTGADGQRLCADMQRHGWHVERIPIDSFGSLDAHARIICKWLRARTEKAIVLVTLSKGSADVRLALAQPDAAEAFAKVTVWISLSGIVYGSALAGWVLDRPFPRAAARLLCWYHGYSFATLKSLDARSGGPLGGKLELPSGPCAVHVVGLPLACHLRNRRSRRGCRRLAALGPSDGGGILLGDLCRLPGFIHPVWGADHYLDPDWDVRPLLRRIVGAALRISGREEILRPPHSPPSSGSAPPPRVPAAAIGSR
jgi:hypothetical protein